MMKKIVLVGLLLNFFPMDLFAMQEDLFDQKNSIAYCLYGLGCALVVSGFFLQNTFQDKIKENPTDRFNHSFEPLSIISVVLGGCLMGVGVHQISSQSENQEQNSDVRVRLNRNPRDLRLCISSKKPFCFN